jgi:spore germination protein KA
MEQMIIGRQTQTSICVVYIDGIAKPDVVKRLKYRLSKLDVDSVIDSGYIEQYIEDSPFSLFPTVGYSEKPDVVAAKILEGRAAVIVDGSPFILTVPMLLNEEFQTSEDYYVRTIYASCIRLLRYIAFAISILAPGVYIALTTYHPELIPTTLLFTIAGAREGTPFPAFLEAVIMIFSFEILREAGVRLPRPVGQAISIVGALVMGQAAVSAGLVGAPMVITIAITAVSEFVIPNLIEAASLLRIIFLICATVLGGFGITMGVIAMFVLIGGLESFGVEFYGGLKISRDYEDSYIRMPLWFMENRPSDTAAGNMKRRIFFIPPARPHKDK